MKKAPLQMRDPAAVVCMQQKYAAMQMVQPPPPRVCPNLTLPEEVVVGTPVARPGSDCSERYSSVLECGGRTLLFSRTERRRGADIGADRWSTTLRHAVSGGFSEAHVSLAEPLNMSHNAVVRCLSDSRIVAYGGRRKERHGRLLLHEKGVWRAEGLMAGAGAGEVSVAWEKPQLVVTGDPSSQCVDERPAVGRQCEFDGKLSSVVWRGETWLFARANLALCGARGVQATRSADGVRGWAPWERLRFDGVPAGTAGENVYFFAVAARGARLVALFPAHLEARCLPRHCPLPTPPPLPAASLPRGPAPYRRHCQRHLHRRHHHPHHLLHDHLLRHLLPWPACCRGAAGST